MPWKKLKEPSKQEFQRIMLRLRGQRAKFLVDESLGINVANALRDRPLRRNVKYVSEVGLVGKSDEDVFAYAWKKKRVLLTHDSDFLQNSRFPFNRNHGVVVITPGASGNQDRKLARALLAIDEAFGNLSAMWVGAKIAIGENNEWTVRWPNGPRDRYLWGREAMHWE